MPPFYTCMKIHLPFCMIIMKKWKTSCWTDQHSYFMNNRTQIIILLPRWSFNYKSCCIVYIDLVFLHLWKQIMLCTLFKRMKSWFFIHDLQIFTKTINQIQVDENLIGSLLGAWTTLDELKAGFLYGRIGQRCFSLVTWLWAGFSINQEACHCVCIIIIVSVHCKLLAPVFINQLRLTPAFIECTIYSLFTQAIKHKWIIITANWN